MTRWGRLGVGGRGDCHPEGCVDQVVEEGKRKGEAAKMGKIW